MLSVQCFHQLFLFPQVLPCLVTCSFKIPALFKRFLPVFGEDTNFVRQDSDAFPELNSTHIFIVINGPVIFTRKKRMRNKKLQKRGRTRLYIFGSKLELTWLKLEPKYERIRQNQQPHHQHRRSFGVFQRGLASSQMMREVYCTQKLDDQQRRDGSGLLLLLHVSSSPNAHSSSTTKIANIYHIQKE